MRTWLLAASLTSCVVLAGCAQVRVTERQFFRPDAPGAVKERLANPAVRALAVPGQDGTMLNGVLLEQPGAHNTVLYFGGNMFHLDRHGDQLLAMLAPCGSNLAVFDYRGYGRNGGKPSVEHLRTDALALFDAVNARHPGRVVVHGQSLGSFMAAYVAAMRPVLGTVLETTATSAEDLVASNIPWYARPFVRIDLEASLRQVDNRVAAARFQAASLVIVAGQDKMTPPRLGKQVFHAIPRSDKQLLLLEQAGHNDALRTDAARNAYCGFVRGRQP
ncbi:alpha/beta hydrolase [Massilia sp. Leaf139]|uniref:alpha/beta hydrolase n=1 Tax=Massilia sp. Leaf139 TaxID=1736272 RepID=UPI0006FDDF34|nr:alpha/beta hydrolase [Massilia sp. Leaf139]KQQ86812.1 hypothetical protein ASF77_19140 [Massilia sp. Leaf139]